VFLKNCLLFKLPGNNQEVPMAAATSNYKPQTSNRFGSPGAASCVPEKLFII